MENKPEGAPDIPVLRKEDKEKKKGLAWLFRGSPSGAASSAGGNAAAVVVRGAAAAAGRGGLLAALTGKLGVAALALGVGAAGLAGYAYLGKGGPAAAKGPNLAPISSNMQVGKRSAEGSRSLSYLADASKGEVTWDDPNAVGAKPKGAAQGDKVEGAKDAAAGEDPANPDMKGLLADAQGKGMSGVAGGLGGLSGAKLSQGTSGGAFGGKSIFSGGSNNLRMPTRPSGQLALARSGPTGKMAAMRKTSTLNARAINTRGARTNKAMGQLKFADKMSSQAKGAGASGEQGAQYAADAFEQGRTQGGNLEGPSTMGDTPAVMGGGGVDAGGDSGGGGGTPDVGNAGNVTPYQGMVDGAQGMSNTAIMLYILAAALLVLAYFCYDMGPYGWIIAVILCAIAAMLIVMGINMADMAGNMGDSVKDIYGQDEQGAIINDEADASKSGKHGTRQGQVKQSGVGGAVAEERNATYQEQ